MNLKVKERSRNTRWKRKERFKAQARTDAPQTDLEMGEGAQESREWAPGNGDLGPTVTKSQVQPTTH